jgi:hypothetical protein
VSLSSHLDDRDSPVRKFLCDTFPDAKAARMSCTVLDLGPVLFMRGLRWTDVPWTGTWNAGEPSVCPDDRTGFPWPTIGTALDYQLRFLLGETSLDRLVARQGAARLATYWAGRDGLPQGYVELTQRFAVMTRASRTWARPETPQGRRELAQLSYVLALYEQCFRGPMSDTWPLLKLGKGASLKKVLGSIRDDALDDLTQLTELFVETQPELMTSTQRIFNPTFAASIGLMGADADLVVDGRLLDIKTKLHGDIRRVDLWQLLGYALGDWNDAHGITEAGFYFSRQGVQVAWDVSTLMELMSNAPQNLGEMRQRFRGVVEGLSADREARLAERRATFAAAVGAGLIGTRPHGHKRDKPNEEIKRSLIFRPPASGAGKWHASCADNRYVRRDGVAAPEATPSCGACVVLDTTARTIRPKVGSHRGDWPDTLCGRCMEMTGAHFWVMDRRKEPVVGPRDRWRFHEPAKRGQRWHITRADFYSQDVVRHGETSGVCNAYGAFKPDGAVIHVDKVDDSDPKYCQHCLRMVAFGGHV